MRKKECSLLSGKGVIDIDFLIAYSLFLVFVVFLISQIFNAMTPFKDFINFQIKEKEIETAYGKLKSNVIPYTDALYSCNHSLPYYSDFYYSYDIMGLNFPYTDPQVQDVNTTTAGEIHFIRNEHDLKVLIGSNSTAYNLSFNIVFPDRFLIKWAKVYFEESDTVDLTVDDFNNKIFNVNVSISNGDIDELQFNITNKKKGLVLLTDVTGIDEEKMFIGELKKKNDCRQVFGDKTKIEFFASIAYKDLTLPAKIKMGGR